MTARLHTHRLTLGTTRALEILDLTVMVRHWVRETGVRQGLLTVMSPHTTARITINEREVALQQDMVAWLEQLAPADRPYGHNRAPVDDRANAHAHLLGLFLNATESVPVVSGELVLGSWQSLFLIELDGPRPLREVQMHLLALD
jgi:secondary thiamine-phosphate synthase enzyme